MKEAAIYCIYSKYFLNRLQKKIYRRASTKILHITKKNTVQNNRY